MKPLLTALIALPLLAGCGSGSGAKVTSLGSQAPVAGTGSTAPAVGPGLVTPSAGPVACTRAPATAPALPGSTTDLSQKPVVKIPAGPPPCGLEVMDIVTGHGPGATDGQQLTVKYVGVTYADGKEFDSSWSRGATSTFPFPLGGHQVISGWDLGLVGAKVGGRRELVIPASLGYGSQGTQGIPPDAALVFVVDVVSIG